MYQEVILDHYKHPHGRGLRDGDAEVHHVNPTCGDEITLRVRYDGETIADVSYEGQGCSISQASASVLNELLVGKELGEAQKIQAAFLELMQSKDSWSRTMRWRRCWRTRSRSPVSPSTRPGSSARC